MSQKICKDFELDKKRYCKGDCKDCNVCKWNNHVTDECMIGSEE